MIVAGVRAAARAHPRAWSVGVVLMAALASSVTGLGNGFAYDDIPVIVENPMVGELHTPAEYLGDSYWGPSRGNSLYRPLTVQLFAWQWAIGGGAPFVFHLANVLLYAASAVAVLGLLRVLLPPLAALVGALAWAVHPVHVEAVANVVGQSEMLAAIPMLVALALYLRARQHGQVGPRVVGAVLGCYAVALLTKEHAILLPALLAAAELAHRRFPRGDDRWADPLAERQPPPWVLARALVLMSIGYLVARTTVLEGLAGDTPHPALEGLGVGERAWAMLALLPEYVRLLVWPVRLYADYSPNTIAVLPTPGIEHLPGALTLLAFAGLLRLAWRRSGLALLALLWVPITLALIANVLIPTGVIIAERTLFLPSVAVALLAGWGWAVLEPRVRAVPTRAIRVAAVGALAVLLVAAAARSAERQTVWEDNASVFSTLVVDAPDNYRAHHALGELFGAAAAWPRAEFHLRVADSLFPGYDLIELSIGRVLHFDDRCPEALAYYEAVLARRPEAEIARIGRAACLLELRRLSDARAEAVDGLARGLSNGPFTLILQKAESSLVANDTVDARNRWWRSGAPVSKSDARLRVPVLMQRTGASQGRRRMPESTPKAP